MTGFLNSAAVSRMTAIDSASSCTRCGGFAWVMWPSNWRDASIPQRNCSNKPGNQQPAKVWNLLAPRAGFEPATIRLTVECSTTELPRNRRTIVRERAAYNKAFRACKGPNRGFPAGIAEKRKGPVTQGFAAGFSPCLDIRGNVPTQRGHPLLSWTSRQIDSIRPEPRGIAGGHGSRFHASHCDRPDTHGAFHYSERRSSPERR